MLTLKTINSNPEEVVRRLSKKHFDAKRLLIKLLAWMNCDEIPRHRLTLF